jgi:hypothetical protein
MATFVSLWIGVLACFMGCALPTLADQRQSGSNVEHCCHSSSKSPVKPNDGKSSSHGMSCCPLEVTVAAKWNAATLAVAPPQHFVLASNPSDLATTWFYHSVEFGAPVWHSGRDTLLETRLLRI